MFLLSFKLILPLLGLYCNVDFSLPVASWGHSLALVCGFSRGGALALELAGFCSCSTQAQHRCGSQTLEHWLDSCGTGA